MKQVAVYFLVFFVSLNGFNANAQPLLLQDPVTSKTFDPGKYSEIKGSPFLFDKWILGSITTTKGVYKNLELKIDVYSNVLYFNKDDNSYELQENIQGFILMPDLSDSSRIMTFKTGFTQAGLRPDQFVQILDEGKVSFYKSDLKLLSEVNEINKGIIKSFTTTSRYFILKDGKMQLIKLNKKEVLSAFSDRQEQIEEFIKQNNVSLNKESGVSALIKFYNSL